MIGINNRKAGIVSIGDKFIFNDELYMITPLFNDYVVGVISIKTGMSYGKSVISMNVSDLTDDELDEIMPPANEISFIGEI